LLISLKGMNIENNPLSNLVWPLGVGNVGLFNTSLSKANLDK